MKTMRKIRRITVLTLALTLLLTGCAVKPAEETATPTEAAQETDLLVDSVQTKDFTMNYMRFGKGSRTLVILPGLSVQSVMGSAEAVKEAYAALTDEFTVWLLEPRTDVPEGFTVGDMAEDAAAALQALKLENVCLFGVSQGGMVALETAARYPGLVDRLVLGSTAARETETLSATLDNWVTLAKDSKTEDLYLAFGEALYPETVFEQSKEQLTDAAKTVTEADLQRFIALAWAMKGFDATKKLKSIACPTLVLGAKDDRVIGGDAAEQLAQGLPDAELYLYEGYGHAAYDLAPDYKERILRFLIPGDAATEALAIIHEPEFGGVYIKMTIDDFNALGFEYGDSVTVAFSNGYALEGLPYYNGYYTANGHPLLIAYPGYDYIKAAINNGDDLWTVAGLSESDTATVTLDQRGTFTDIQSARDIHYTDVRTDYPDDAVFANFRSVKAGRILPETLYRSASPCDNQHNRATFVNGLIKEAGVRYIVDLADNEEKIEKYIAAEDFACDYFLDLYREGNVIPLALNMNFGSAVFAEKIVRGLTAMADHDGPYLVHCTEGKDRTGFVCMLLEALCGATYDEIVADYMITYDNYYRINPTDDSARYTVIVENVLDPMIRSMVGSEEADLAATDLEEAAKAYLLKAGMPEETLAALTTRLCG